MKAKSLKLRDANGVEMRSKNRKADSGFTLIELLVVVIIIGVLATISAPSWFGFVRQRRVNATYNFVLQSIREAQSTARKKKQDYSVSFRYYNGIPQVAIHPAGFDPSASNNDMEGYWRSPENLQKNQVLIQTNLPDNNASPQTSTTVTTLPDNQKTKTRITFDDAGVLKKNTLLPIAIVLAAPKTLNPDEKQTTSATKRCITIRTLLGGITPGRGLQEPTRNPLGCPQDS